MRICTFLDLFSLTEIQYLQRESREKETHIKYDA